MFSLINKPRKSQTAVNTQFERRLPNNERESKKLQGSRERLDTPPTIIATISVDRNDDRSGFSALTCSSHPEALLGSNLSLSPNAKVPPDHLLENDQEISEFRKAAQGSPALKDDYQLLKDDLKLIYSEALKHKLQMTDGEMREAKRDINRLEEEKRLMKEQIGNLRNELTNVHQQLEDDKTHSGVRGKRIFGSQAFLNRADTLLISEVSEKVVVLNEDIYEAAATLGENLIHRRHELSQEDLDAAIASSREMVGGTISDLLISQAQKPETEVNAILVQVVLQIFMVRFCVSKIQSWYPSDSTIGEFLKAIYTTIRSSEEQAVSGRWRALTRAHTRPSTEAWTDELTQKLMAILKIAAWMPRTPENVVSFENLIPPIFKAVDELRISIGEKYTSADLDVSIFDSGKFYDPSHMEDVYGDASDKRAPETIIGTTGIGLKRLMAKRNANHYMFHSVTPAKIVLESTLMEALEPAQSSGRRMKKKPIENTDGDGDSISSGSW